MKASPRLMKKERAEEPSPASWVGGADLSRANLEGATLDGANLDGVNLDGAILKGTNLCDAQVTEQQLATATGDSIRSICV